MCLLLYFCITIFQAIIVSRILYALPALGCFLSKELSGRIDAFLKRCCRYGFASEHILLYKICAMTCVTDSASHYSVK